MNLPLKRWHWRAARNVYVIGVTYFQIWDWRYVDSTELGAPDKVVRCLELSLWWWELQFFWLAPWEGRTA